jgi:hypothetical protein
MKQIDIIIDKKIDRAIIMIRGEKVMLDADLASLYKVQTKALNQAVKRNHGRFPSDFMFQLTKYEKEEVVTKCDHLKQLKFSPHLPYAFTEHGAVMLANVLNSTVAVETSINIVRAFIRLRKMLASNAALARKIKALEKKYDEQFGVVFEAIYQLMDASEKKSNKKIGLKRGDT